MSLLIRVAAVLAVVCLSLSGGAVWFGQARPDAALLIAAVRQNSRFDYNDLVLVDLDQCRRHALPLLSISDALAWSPDGESIAFLSSEAGAVEIHTAAINGTGIRRVTENFTQDAHVAYSPTGDALAFTASLGIAFDIMHIDLTTRAESALTPAGAGNMSPTWSPDGAEIAYITNSGGHFHLAALDVATGIQRSIHDRPDRWLFAPQFSPDGTHIAFFSVDQAYGDPRLHVIDRDGAARWELAAADERGDYLADVEWSPDGEWIAFLRRGGIAAGVFAVSADGTTTRPLACLPRLTVAFAWKRG
ncbi:MAG: hypothetical protein SF162_11775 [bacterium]|nr:hypothetical protein [bacterium]